MADLLIRFLIGGLFVSGFALLGDILKPKSFAGLFGAAPSVALATLILTMHDEGTAFAAMEARSMILGAIAFLVYASAVCFVMMRLHPPAWMAVGILLIAWIVVGLGLQLSIAR
jgi:uncharacterized membrane protein (GlpM family)